MALKVKGMDAKACLTDEGIVVLKSSRAAKVVKSSLSNGYKKLRNQLIENGVLKEDAGGYVFTKNHLFKSPSQAAAIIVGYAINGRQNWCTSEGIDLKSYEESVNKES